MLVMRQVNERDFPAYEFLAKRIDVGVTSFPRDHKTLKIKMNNILNSFSGKEMSPDEILYLFFLEEMETGEVIGTSGINAKTGENDPLYFYTIQTEMRQQIYPEMPSEIKVLVPKIVQEAFTELFGLYILPEKRKGGLGHLLSFGRFLYMADYPKEIQERITAVIRGTIDAHGVSPFWELVGRKFLDIDFVKLCELISQSKAFVPSILPKHPLYVPLLPKEIQELIGVPHPASKPALQILLTEGFHITNDVDITDIGPRIEGSLKNLVTINSSHKAIVTKVDENLPEEHNLLISRPEPTFRACLGKLEVIGTNQVALSPLTAKALQVEPGQVIRYVNAHKNS